jgi:hypothetical protein
MSVVGILPDDADPMVSVMKVEKAPLESYADIGGLHEQVDVNTFIYTLQCIFLYCTSILTTI